MMTPDTFKELCMVSSTAKGREVRGYYIKMEKVLKAYMKEKLAERTASETRLLMEKAEAESKLAAELEKQTQRKYVSVPQVDNAYVTKEAAELGTDSHKIGKTLNTSTREKTFNTGSARGVKMLHSRATHNGGLVENIVAAVMKRYHYQREHYMCNVEHSINVIDVAATVIDTLASCYDCMSREEMFDKVMENLEAIRSDMDAPCHLPRGSGCGGEERQNDMQRKDGEGVARFIRERCEVGDGRKVAADALYAAFASHTGTTENRKKWFGGQMKRRGFVGKTVRVADPGGFSQLPAWGYDGITLREDAGSGEGGV